MNELPEKVRLGQQADFLENIDKLAETTDSIIDYLKTHTIPQETKQWAYTFLGDTANIRCGEEIKTVQIFQGSKTYIFPIPD